MRCSDAVSGLRDNGTRWIKEQGTDRTTTVLVRSPRLREG